VVLGVADLQEVSRVGLPVVARVRRLRRATRHRRGVALSPPTRTRLRTLFHPTNPGGGRSIGIRTRSPPGAVVTACFLVVVEVAESLTAWSSREEYAATVRDEVPVESIFTAYDLVATVWILAAVAAYVTNCLWLWWARQNAEIPGTRAQRLPRAWVWTGWIVPIVNLWVPFQIVRDVRRAPRDRSDNVLLRLWWTGWLAFGLGVGSRRVCVCDQCACSCGDSGRASRDLRWDFVVRDRAAHRARARGHDTS
jgi:hypothetical protein